MRRKATKRQEKKLSIIQRITESRLLLVLIVLAVFGLAYLILKPAITGFVVRESAPFDKIWNGTFDTSDKVNFGVWNVSTKAAADWFYSTQLINTRNFTLNFTGKQWNASFDTTGKTAGLWNVSTYAIADFFFRTQRDNVRNFTLISIGDTTKPVISGTINNTAPKRFEIINATFNITDETGLSSGNITFNLSGPNSYNFTFVLSGTSAQISQNITINLTRGDVINITGYARDTSGNVKQNSTLITIANTPPPQVTLIAPPTSNQTINRTPTFTWNNVTDADNDSLLFNILIVCVGCSSDNRDVNTTNLNFTPSELQFLGDENFYYNWSVRAIDNLSSVTSFGVFSEIRNITINSFVSLSLLTSTVNFGTLELGKNDNTTDDIPAPIVMDNDGNVFENVSVYAADDLWESIANPTDKFQFKIGNVTIELGSFNWTASTTIFTNLPTAAVTAVVDLNYSDASDSAEADIKIEVPTDEPAGTKQSKVVFEAKRSR